MLAQEMAQLLAVDDHTKHRLSLEKGLKHTS